MESKPQGKRILSIIKSVFVWLVLAVSVFMMVFTLISVNTFDKNDRSLFGYKFFVVRTDSMSATDFDAGDIIISKEVELSSLKEGDIITFVSQNPSSYGQTITHKIRTVTKDANGSTAFVTYGTTTDTDDEALATMVVGQYQTKIPNLGHFFAFLKTTPGYIVCILVPFLLLLLSQGINCVRLFRRYKSEQMENLQVERDKIEAEREESRKMMEELLALKAQLAQMDTTGAPAAQADTAPAPEEPAEATPVETEETTAEATEPVTKEASSEE